MSDLAAPDALTLQRAILTIQALTGQPAAACTRVALAYAFGLDALIDGLIAGTVTVTAAGTVTSTGAAPYSWVLDDSALVATLRPIAVALVTELDALGPPVLHYYRHPPRRQPFPGERPPRRLARRAHKRKLRR